MLFQVVLLVYFYFVGRALALQCRNCSQTLDLTVSQINVTNATCGLVAAPYASCSQRLHIRYTKNETTVVLRANPDESLMLSNEAKIMTNTTLIWLNKLQFERIFQIYCFNNEVCEANTINATYVQARQLSYAQVWANVVTFLYDDQSNATELVCADDQNEAVPCPAGFCQLTSNDLITFSSRCVPKGTMNNTYGVILESKTVPGGGIASSMSYTCNTPMCNNLTMAKQIQSFLVTRQLTVSVSTTTTTTTTTTSTSTTTATSTTATTSTTTMTTSSTTTTATRTTTTTVTTSSSSSGETRKAMVYMQYSFALLMAIIFSK